MIVRIMKKISLFSGVKNTGSHEKDAIVDIKDEVALFLIEQGVAEEVVKPAKKTKVEAEPEVKE